MTPRTVVITGANRGIGLALGKLFAARGDRVVAVIRTCSPELLNLADTIVTTEDVADPELSSRVAEALDGDRIDILLNVAGIMHCEQLCELEPATITRQFEVNAMAPLLLSAGLADRMATGGRIAFLTSRLGSLADNESGAGYGYRMSKAALNTAARSLAVDLKPRGVAVGLIHPGSVKTSLNQLGGEIEVEEAARGILARIDELSLENTGSYRHQNGVDLPW